MLFILLILFQGCSVKKEVKINKVGKENQKNGIDVTVFFQGCAFFIFKFFFL